MYVLLLPGHEQLSLTLDWAGKTCAAILITHLCTLKDGNKYFTVLCTKWVLADYRSCFPINIPFPANKCPFLLFGDFKCCLAGEKIQYRSCHILGQCSNCWFSVQEQVILVLLHFTHVLLVLCFCCSPQTWKLLSKYCWFYLYYTTIKSDSTPELLLQRTAEQDTNFTLKTGKLSCYLHCTD